MRSGSIERKTKETQIFIYWDLDGGDISIETGIGFFDHMLEAFAVHGNFGLTVKVDGDLHVDCHHTIEDTGIVLGQVLNQILESKSGIKRYGTFYIPMDETLAFASIDISGRPFLVFNGDFPQSTSLNFDYCMVEEFFRAFAFNSKVTLHINKMYGSNSHHIAEAMFKAVSHALKEAVTVSNVAKPLSTKGCLD